MTISKFDSTSEPRATSTLESISLFHSVIAERKDTPEEFVDSVLREQVIQIEIVSRGLNPTSALTERAQTHASNIIKYYTPSERNKIISILAGIARTPLENMNKASGWDAEQRASAFKTRNAARQILNEYKSLTHPKNH